MATQARVAGLFTSLQGERGFRDRGRGDDRFHLRHPYFVVRGEDLEDRPRLEHLAKVPEGATTPGRWVDAVDLRVGDELILRDGRIEPIERIRLYGSFEMVYNFDVDALHCYAVGRSAFSCITATERS